jgi:acyl carrier protein
LASAELDEEAALEIAERIRAIIAKQVSRPPEEITDEINLAALGLDSLDLLEVIFEIESQFDIDLPYNANNPEELGLTTFGEMARKIEAEISGR